MSSSDAVDQQLGARFVERIKSKINAFFQQFRGLLLKIIVSKIQQDFYSELLEGRVVVFPCHVDHMGYTGAHNRSHLLLSFDPAADSYPVHHPANIQDSGFTYLLHYLPIDLIHS